MKSAIALFALVAFSPLSALSAPSPSATIADGVIVGFQTSIPGAPNKVNRFHSIPFAQPPVKDLRFAPPVSPKKWTSPLKTQNYAPACMQEFNYPAASRNFTIEAFNTPGPPAGMSEDCLYLDVYAPASGTKGKTVMFWIYGGGLQFGSNSIWAYNGTIFAANQDVIVVIPNYRTNLFGFSGAPGLPLTSRNAGFLDQRAALQWVQANIHAFGGDPKKVTIFGESAGATSVDELITTFPENPPFRAAILESGSASFGIPASVTAPKVIPWKQLMGKIGCAGGPAQMLACARSKPAAQLLSISEHLELDWTPSADNVTALSDPTGARLAGKIAQVPVLLGNNLQEGRVFTVGLTNLTAFLLATFPGAPQLYYDELIAAYPIGSLGLDNSFDVIAQIYTDFIFWCPTANVANSSATTGKVPTWRYLYNATFPNLQLFKGIGVFHSIEIVEVFGTYPTAGATPTEMSFSVFMQTAWANFAKNPSQGPGWANWPNVGVLGTTDGMGTVLENVTNAQAGVAGLDKRCALYAPVYAAVGVPPP